MGHRGHRVVRPDPGGASPPSPSWADAFWLGFYPPAYVAVVLFMRREVRWIADSSWLDGAVAGLGAASVCAAFAFQGLRAIGGGQFAGQSHQPGLSHRGRAAVCSGRRRHDLALGQDDGPLDPLSGGDGPERRGRHVQPVPIVPRTPRVDTVFHALAWPAAGLLMSIAVWLRPRPPNLLGYQKPAGFVLPGLAAVSALVILFVGSFHHVSRVALVLAAATLIAVGLRLALYRCGDLRTVTQDRLRQSVTDELTGLRNRRYLFRVLDTFFGSQIDRRSTKRKLAFLFVDLNHFKEINDSFGHSAGDELLKQLGPRLTASLRGSEVLVRLGGDEFGDRPIGRRRRRCHGGRAASHGEHRGTVRPRGCQRQRQREHRVSPRRPETPPIAPGFCGVPTSRCTEPSWATLPSPSTTLISTRAGTSGALAKSCVWPSRKDSLSLHYQPQLDLHSGEISAVEALLRWPHARLGFVPPLKFLPLAEEARLMPSLTTWVLDHALAQCASWRATGQCVTVSVNASPTNLLDPGFTDLVWDLLNRHGLPAQALVLEVTETSIIANLEGTKRVIEELRDLGVVVSIDDFGAGFTSLAYLSDLAVGELKLDGIFVTDLAAGNRERDLELVRATIELGHAMGLRVVAECIEDKQTLDLLADLGCDLGQGYFISRPMPADRLSFRSELLSSAPAAALTR